MPSRRREEGRRHQDEAAKDEEGDATPEISKCNTCNIRLKTDETFKRWI
jgi:hypothetical protein